MIHFNFKVEDIDAENIFDIMRQSIQSNNRYIQKAIINGEDDIVQVYTKQNEYIEYLIKSMKNTKCEK